MRARSGGTEGQRWWGGGTAARMSRAPPRRLHIRRTRAAASPPRTAPPRRHHVRHHLCVSPLRRAVADSHPKSDHRVLLAWCTTRLPAAVRHGDEVVQRGCPQRGARRLVARPVAPGVVVDAQLHRGYLIYFIPGFLWCFIIYNWKCETYILKDFHAAGWPS